jgi:hypothetical protein
MKLKKRVLVKIVMWFVVVMTVVSTLAFMASLGS